MRLNDNELLLLAKSIQELYDNLNQSNLLDTVYVNENVHSRILRLFLNYHEENRNPLYESFVRIDKVARIFPDGFVPGVPLFYNERDRIDLLIEGKDYAIIVENKIYYAIDQDKQLERYLDSCIGRGIDPKRLFVLYLTADGTKTVSSSSLTEKAKEILGVTLNSSGRFAEINFRYDLLPWLREALRSAGDRVDIQSALIQYADYLAGMFGERDKESKTKTKMIEQFKASGIDSIVSYSENIEATNTLLNKLCSQRDEMCCELANRFVTGTLKEYCEKRGISLLPESYSFGFLTIQMTMPGFSKSTFRFNTEGDGRNIYGICNIDVHDGEILSDSALIRMENTYSGYKQSPWWPVYKYPQNREIIRTGSSDFWENVVPTHFALEVIKAYEEIEDLLHDEEKM